MTPIIPYLQENGWKEWADPFRKYARCFYKRFETPTRCHCNNDQEGIQICIAVSNLKDFGHDKDTYEIDLHGELSDETWLHLKIHGCPDDIEEGILKIPRMLVLWELAAKPASSTKLFDWNNPAFAVKRAEDMSKISVYKWFAVKRKVPIDGDINYTAIQEFELDYYKGWEVIG